MASGSFISETKTGLEIGVEWSSVPDASTGTSKVKADVFLTHYSIYCVALSGSYVKIGSSTHSFAKEVSKTENVFTKTYIASYEADVTHSSDGTASVTISAGWVFNGTYGSNYIGTVKVEKTVTLDVIPRSSVLTVPSTVDIGAETQISISSHVSSNKHRIQYSIGDTDLYTGYLTGTSPKITPPAALAECITGKNSASGKMILHTYNSSGTWTGQNEKTVTYRVPDNDTFRPDFTLTASPDSPSFLVKERGIFAAGITKAKVQVTGAAAKYGASVKSCSITVGASKFSGYSATSNWLSAGNVEISAKVTDSRGRSRTKNLTANVLAYCLPFVTETSVFRCDETGIPSDTGAYIHISARSVFSALDGSNGADISFAWKKHSDESYSAERELVSGETLIFSASLASASSYDVKLICRDVAGGETESIVLIPTALVDMHMKNGSVRFGGYCEKSGFECNWDANFGGKLTLKEEPLADFVVETGQSGIWTWRKWSSGISECFGNTGEATYNVNTSWGALYYNSSDGKRNSKEFPEGLFADAPVVQASVRRGATAPFLLPKTNATKDASPEYYVVYPTSGEHTVSIDLYCIGRWK